MTQKKSIIPTIQFHDREKKKQKQKKKNKSLFTEYINVCITYLTGMLEKKGKKEKKTKQTLCICLDGGSNRRRFDTKSTMTYALPTELAGYLCITRSWKILSIKFSSSGAGKV